MDESNLLKEYINIYISAIKYVEDLVSKPTQEYGLSFEQFLILEEINSNKSISLKDIAAKRRVTRGAISRQASVLIKNGYISQEIDPSDRRRMILHLTDTGAKVYSDLVPKVQARFNTWLEDFGIEKATKMLDLMTEFKEKVMTDVLD